MSYKLVTYPATTFKKQVVKAVKLHVLLSIVFAQQNIPSLATGLRRSRLNQELAVVIQHA
ncbi:MAG: hypothetical protein FWG61_07370 [Firmicutes bacterium]|nr:hypothetical protein [Bacillota bacterium]